MPPQTILPLLPGAPSHSYRSGSFQPKTVTQWVSTTRALITSRDKTSRRKVALQWLDDAISTRFFPGLGWPPSLCWLCPLGGSPSRSKMAAIIQTSSQGRITSGGENVVCSVSLFSKPYQHHPADLRLRTGHVKPWWPQTTMESP